MDFGQISLERHREKRGKLDVIPTFPLETRDDLAIAYTPGVAAVCQEIAAHPERVSELTIQGRSIAVVTDGSAVLGLGNIGALAALPVMEGKAILFKHFGGLDAYPICLATQDVDEIVRAVLAIAPGFAGINLEDISAPRCFEVERRLVEALNIPVMHDDQHGTAIVVLAALTNALKVTNRDLAAASIVISGAGAAGLATAELLLAAGVRRLTVLDSRGIIATGREGMNIYKEDLARRINPERRTGTLVDALQNADVFIGVSQPGIVTAEMVKSMAPQPIVFAMANPIPEIMPDVAKAAGAAVVATGRSDYPNQVNNVLVFPGIFAGAIKSGLKRFTPAVRLAAAHALADLVADPQPERILPSPLEPGVAEAVAGAIARA
ncbi:MAG: NADP-dependent malic enzyme [Patescibacteria group bacterium]|nr:NADP-dependent malic enzyme [Patescibacteria group bacterium]